MDINDSSIKYICASHSHRRDDGLLVVDRFNPNHDFTIDYYNNDGTWETLCANGALCVINLLSIIAHKFNYMTFEAGDGIHDIKFENSKIFIGMKQPEFKTEEIKISSQLGRHIDSGAKHFVTKSETKNLDKLYEIAQKIRYHDIFQPHGINVNFLKVNNSNEISVVTYEKGIEKIMLSCGSGSVAAAFYAFHMDGVRSPLNIVNQGGDMLLIFNESWDRVWFSSNPILDKTSEINCL